MSGNDMTAAECREEIIKALEYDIIEAIKKVGDPRKLKLIYKFILGLS